MKGSLIADIETEAGSNGEPGAQTDATHKVRQATSRPKPYKPVFFLNILIRVIQKIK